MLIFVAGFLNTYLSQEESETDGLDTEDQGSQDDEDDENMSDDSTNTMLQSCLAAIVDTLSQHNPRYGHYTDYSSKSLHTG